MNRMKKSAFCISLLAFGLLGLHDANAGTTTAVMSVTATVTAPACSSISATSMSFAYTSGSSAVAPSTSATVTLTCGGAFPFTLDGNGGTAPNVNGSRNMSDGVGHGLFYNVYKDNAFANVFGTGITGGTTITGTTASPSSTVQLFGRDSTPQTSPAGTYTDSVTLTLTF